VAYFKVLPSRHSCKRKSMKILDEKVTGKVVPVLN
jgi:hypothetical protein